MTVMRFVVAMVLAGLAVLPLSVSAQAGGEDATLEPNLEEPAAPSEPAGEEGGLSPRLRKRTRQKWDPGTYDVPPSRPSPEEPALQLELDSAGGGFTLIPASQRPKRELDARQRAGIGLGVSLVALGAGIGMATAAVGGSFSACILEPEPCYSPRWVAPVGITGGLLAVGGFVGIAVSVHELRKHQRARNGSRHAHFGTPHRVQWDVARSQLVF